VPDRSGKPGIDGALFESLPKARALIAWDEMAPLAHAARFAQDGGAADGHRRRAKIVDYFTRGRLAGGGPAAALFRD
jgi:hypothetical protein